MISCGCRRGRKQCNSQETGQGSVINLSGFFLLWFKDCFFKVVCLIKCTTDFMSLPLKSIFELWIRPWPLWLMVGLLASLFSELCLYFSGSRSLSRICVIFFRFLFSSGLRYSEFLIFFVLFSIQRFLWVSLWIFLCPVLFWLVSFLTIHYILNSVINNYIWLLAVAWTWPCSFLGNISKVACHCLLSRS